VAERGPLVLDLSGSVNGYGCRHPRRVPRQEHTGFRFYVSSFHISLLNTLLSLLFEAPGRATALPSLPDLKMSFILLNVDIKDVSRI
jgi:hypothetical protein